MNFADLLVEQLPYLQKFAHMLACDARLAEDLVQETALRALCNCDKFTPGTNIRAWLSTILRNQFYSELRTRSRMAAYLKTPAPVSCSGEQEWRIRMNEFECALHDLPATQREALSLVGATGFSYEDAAALIGCAEGTVKSRVGRARMALSRKLGFDLIETGEPEAARLKRPHKAVAANLSATETRPQRCTIH